MTSRKRITLPDGFDTLLVDASSEEVIAVFDRCIPDATFGRGGTTALASANCTDDVSVWLVEHGATVDHRDRYGRTPFHHRCTSRGANAALLVRLGADIESRDHEGYTPLHAVAQSHHVHRVRELLALGALVTAQTHDGRTPLGVVLASSSNAMLERTAVIADLLVAAGEVITGDMREQVERIGRRFEFYRDSFNPDYLTEADRGLRALYRRFDVAPVPRRQTPHTTTPIVVTSSDWRDRHDELWQMLVPPMGAASTVQGEVIRITGRIGHELLDNGGVNWRGEHRATLIALLAHLRSAVGLATTTSDELDRAVAGLGTDRDDAEVVALLAEAAVEWVMANPSPIPLSR